MQMVSPPKNLNLATQDISLSFSRANIKLYLINGTIIVPSPKNDHSSRSSLICGIWDFGDFCQSTISWGESK